MAAELYVLLVVLLAWEVGRLPSQIPGLCALCMWHSTLRAHLVPIAPRQSWAAAARCAHSPTQTCQPNGL